MGAEDSPPRFVVLVNGCARYWGHSQEDAQARYDRDLEVHLEGKNPVFWPDDEVRVEKISDQVFFCPTHHEEQLLFQPEGWVGCPVCGSLLRLS